MGKVTQQVDQKVYNLIHDLLALKTEQSKTSNTDADPNSLLHIALAKDLTTAEVVEFVLEKDALLKRLKRKVVESSVDAVLNEFVQDEAEELAEVIKFKEMNIVEENSELVDAVDTNELNKAVVLQWTTKKRKEKPLAKTTKRSKVDHLTPQVTLSSLGGLQTVTAQLMELVGLPILHPEIYKATGVEPPRGVLLYGPPGCGKTTVANALAGELKVPFINISAPLVVSGMSGESEKKLREIFEEARSLAPCLIFIDEIDAITPKRDGGAQREMERRIVAQLLTLMDELLLEKTGSPVIVIGATNRPDSLDSALRRAGRFDREICLSVPSEEQRSMILQTMTLHLKMSGDFDYRYLAKMTPGFVGADLKSLVTAAGTAAIKRIFESLDVQMEDGESTIQRFLEKHTEPLTMEQLEPLCITYADFTAALPSIQPTAKREGFATVPDVTWKHVGALARVRMELHMCIVQPIQKPELYQRVGISAPAGVLMWGPPGCGKTLLAKAVANELRANFISVKGPELLNKYVGESERSVRQVFQRARASAPCIIFFDELDALVPRRTSSLSELSGRVVNTLLTELDGLNDRNGIFVVGATNRPDMIDPAMLRPGRLDKTLYIELPNAEERTEILKTLVLANNTPLAPDVDLLRVANDLRCRNFSGADLLSLVREAGVFTLKKRFFTNVAELDESSFYGGADEGSVVVTANDFDMALGSIRPSVSDRDRARYERLNLRLGWGVIEEEKANEA